MTLEVLAVVSEIYPLVKTGGLADVAGALPAALRRYDVHVTTMVPGYPAVAGRLENAETVLSFPDLFGGEGRLVAGRAAGLDLLVIDAPHLFGRPGNPYLGADGKDWPDNALRFGALSWAAAQVGLGAVTRLRPDIVHCHDWQAGLAPAYLALDGGPRPATVMTIHNLAFQGVFPAGLLGALRLPPRAWSIDGVEYYDSISFLKAGLYFADRLTTVSPTYAREIRTEAGGFGLDGLLRMRAAALSGIVNGIDTEIWDPAQDRAIASPFDRENLAARAPNKVALQARFGLTPDPSRLLLGAVTRLTSQKGMDLLAAGLDGLLATSLQVVLLGSGDADLERRFTELAGTHRGRFGCVIGYDEDLAHQIQAGTDALLVPSRFEPCGLTQLCALRYGAVPVVANVGGLADTVIDIGAPPYRADATGVQFEPATAAAFHTAVARTAQLWADRPAWLRVQQSGMATDVSWDSSAAQYARLYNGLRTNKN